MRLAHASLVCALSAALLAGCGSDDGGDGGDSARQVPPSLQEQLRAAQRVDLGAFPKPAGRSLEDLAQDLDTRGPQAVLASSVFRPGANRIAFGLLDENVRFAYGSTVVYLQRAAGGPVRGPFPAPADVLITEPRYRSHHAATEKDPFAAVYAATAKLTQTGIWNGLVVSDLGGGRRIAATMDLEVVSKAEDRIPDVGERAPRVDTDTIASGGGDVKLVDTRIPPAEELHQTSFADVVGRKPVALLFATPQLCQSRVCGPVVDEALQLKARFGDRIEFIHQEVYVDNDPNQGLRAPLRRFHLQTEPWLFTVRADGTIAARLEGSFGLRAFEEALERAL